MMNHLSSKDLATRFIPRHKCTALTLVTFGVKACLQGAGQFPRLRLTASKLRDALTFYQIDPILVQPGKLIVSIGLDENREKSLKEVDNVKWVF